MTQYKVNEIGENDALKETLFNEMLERLETAGTCDDNFHRLKLVYTGSSEFCMHACK